MVKKRKNRCEINLHDLIFVKLLTLEFKCLTIGTAQSKAEDLTKIALVLYPYFIFSKIIPDKETDLELILQKALRIFTMPESIERRIENIREKDSSRVQEVEKEIINFLNDKRGSFETLEDLPVFEKFRVWRRQEIKNLLQHRYLSAFNRQIYSFDTTKVCKNCELTLLIDNSSRLIVKHIVTVNPPAADLVVNMFDEYFTGDILNRCKIVHCDRTGANISTDFAFYCEKKNIVLSHSDSEKHMNQLVESANGIVKNIINKIKSFEFENNIKFSVLPKTFKDDRIIFAINEYNTGVTTFKYSRILIDEAKEFIRYKNPNIVDATVRIEKPQTKSGEFLIAWTDTLANVYSLIKKQFYILEKYQLIIDIIPEEILTRMLNIFLEENNINLQKVQELYQNEKKIITLFLQKSPELYPNTNEEDFLIELEELLQIEVQKSGDYIKKALELVSFNQTKHEKENSERILKFYSFYHNYKRITKSTIDITSSYEIYQSKVNKETVNRGLKKKYIDSIQSKKDCALMIKEFPILLETVEKRYDKKFTIAKYSIGHLIMKITGCPVSSLKYFNFTQIDNLYNKRAFFIIVEKSRHYDQIKIDFPYVKELDFYLNLTAHHFEYLKMCKEQNTDDFYKIPENLKGYQKYRSEIFGWTNRPTVDTQMNDHLLKTSMKLNLPKKLTTKCYRNTMTILVTNKFGTVARKHILGEINFNSMENYNNEVITIQKMQEILSWVHKIDNKKIK